MDDESSDVEDHVHDDVTEVLGVPSKIFVKMNKETTVIEELKTIITDDSDDYSDDDYDDDTDGDDDGDNDDDYYYYEGDSDSDSDDEDVLSDDDSNVNLDYEKEVGNAFATALTTL